MKSLFDFRLSIIFFAFLLVACQRTESIVILYENDVHCAVEGYARMAGQRDAELQSTPYVTQSY